MSGDDSARFLYALIMLVVVASALFSRRIPMSQIARHALTWAGIFAVLFVLFSFRGEVREGWNRVSAEVSPGGSVGAGGIVRLKKDDTGHFIADVEINGESVRMLVDSGATVTAISMDTARRVGMDVDRSAFPVVVETANGMAHAWRATAQSLELSGIRREDFPVHVSETLGGTDLLGMNFLSTLKSWRVEGDTMLLEP